MASEPSLFFVIDVESIGLMGEGFATAYVVVDRDGNEKDCDILVSNPDLSPGTAGDREWVNAHVVPGTMADNMVLPLYAVRDNFWAAWGRWRMEGAWMAAECPYPVEANFLNACIAQDRVRKTPHPIIDVTSVMLAAGMDPMASYDRLPSELPAHNPLADARQSARLLIEALSVTRP